MNLGEYELSISDHMGEKPNNDIDNRNVFIVQFIISVQ